MPLPINQCGVGHWQNQNAMRIMPQCGADVQQVRLVAESQPSRYAA
jgi:hypothetical protein